MSLENDCNLFEKAKQLSVDVNIIHNKSSLLREKCRSRYAKFLTSELCVVHKPSAVLRRTDREPSRIPIKQLTRVMNKGRNVRKLIHKYIAKNVPMSSKIHCYINVSRQYKAPNKIICLYRFFGLLSLKAHI